MKFNHLTLVVALAILLSFANGAPQTRRHRRHWFGSVNDDAYHPSKIQWKNSCGDKNDTIEDHRIRTQKPFKGLRNELPNFIVRLKTQTQAISTNETQWFSEQFNATYHFLAQINASNSNIHLRKRHIETQIYVGAFQYLRWKQLNHDMLRNESRNKTNAMQNLLILAKNLLCEIETAIKNTCMKMPMILSREAMNNRLTFRNNNRRRDHFDDVDEIDSTFAKIRFNEYLHGLQQVLRNRMGKQHHHNNQKASKSANANGASVSQIIKPVNSSQHLNPNENDIDSSFSATKKHPMHRNLGMKHRNRTGLSKQRRNRKQPQKVAGLRLNDMKHFRSQLPRNNRKSTMLSQAVGTGASATHPATQT